MNFKLFDSQEVKARFWKLVNVIDDNECWVWRNGNTRPTFTVGNISYPASRVSYYLSYGTFNETKLVCHTCDNKLCVNPKHLYLGTHNDNTRDMIKRGKYVSNFSHKQGHSILTEKQVLWLKILKDVYNIPLADIANIFNISYDHAERVSNNRQRING